MRRVLVCGAGGFIGGYLVTRLKQEGHYVLAVDLKQHEYKSVQDADQFIVGDLRDPTFVESLFTDGIDDIYQLAADMGGAEFIFSGENDSEIMHNSALINLNICHAAVKHGVKRIFYSSSACIYPERNQLNPDNPNCEESSAYPAAPDSEYGWEKLFSERLYLAFAKNHGLEVHIARFHNIFGPLGTWCGGREKAPAALCRKVAECPDGGSIDIFGDGEQTRSFLYVEECVEGVLRLMNSNFSGPVNIGSDEMISINNLALMIADIAGKNIKLNHIKGPLGVRGRNSDNRLIQKQLGWQPSQPLRVGIEKTFNWINKLVNHSTSQKEV